MTLEGLEDRILAFYEELVEMRVALSAIPQSESFDYIHEKVEEIHRHSTYLTDLIVQVNRWKAYLDHLVERQKQIVDFKFNEVLITDADVRRKKSVGERKSAAARHVKDLQADLLELKRQQLEVNQLGRSLTRKAAELKGKSIDLKLQEKVMELEWNQTGQYRGSRKRSDHAPNNKPPPRKYEEETPHEQTPTAEDLDLTLEIRAQSISKNSNPEPSENEVEEVLEGPVEITGAVESLALVSEAESKEELSVDEGAAPQGDLALPPVQEQDLDTLLAGVDLVNGGRQGLKVAEEEGNQEARFTSVSVKEESVLEPPPVSKVGEVIDFDALLEDI